MEDHPMQFTSKSGMEGSGVLPDPRHTDIYLPLYHTGGLREMKGDDVRKIMVIQESLVDLQEVGIITENIIEGRDPVPLLLRQPTQERLQYRPVLQNRCGRWKKEIDLTHECGKINVPCIKAGR